MKRERWTAAPGDGVLGAVVHGPIVLAAVRGVAVALRCVFAHPTGLQLPLVLIATGVHAEAAGRQSGHPAVPRGHQASEPPSLSQLQLQGELNGRAGEMEPFSASSGAGLDRYHHQADYWIDDLPGDGVLRLTVGWPRIGLEPATTTIDLGPPDRIAAGAVTLSPS